MDYKRFLIIASKKDRAGMNIVQQIPQFGNFDIEIIEGSLLNTQDLPLEKIKTYDVVIFASKHESQKKEKTLSVHAPGNVREAHGGSENTLCMSSAVFQKQLFEQLNKVVEEHKIDNYKVTLEATHHGPAIDTPCVFIEVGSTEIEWTDRRAGFILAKTITRTIESYQQNPYNEIAIAIGGPHYCPVFNKIQEKSNVAIAHVIAQYHLPITEEILREAIAKTAEEVDFFLLDWKGIGNAEARTQLCALLDKHYFAYRRTTQITYE